MPVSRFFAMLEAKRDLEKAEHMTLLNIAAVSVGHKAWYDWMSEQFSGKRIDPPQYPDKPLNLGAMDAASDEAKYSVMGIFAAKRKLGLVHG